MKLRQSSNVCGVYDMGVKTKNIIIQKKMCVIEVWIICHFIIYIIFIKYRAINIKR